jgi:hypothetical protein
MGQGQFVAVQITREEDQTYLGEFILRASRLGVTMMSEAKDSFRAERDDNSIAAPLLIVRQK